MNREEFAAILYYLAAGVGRDVSDAQLEVYFDLLGDLPADVLRRAAQRALLESQYPTLPPVGVLRRLAAEAMAPRQLAACEAWGLTLRAVEAFGYDQELRGLESLPPLVRRAAECLGWQTICASTEPEICRAQFAKAFEALAGREQRESLLPPSLREALGRVGRAEGLLSPPR